MDSDSNPDRSGLGFTEILLGGVILLIATGILGGIALYLLPAGHLEIPELQPSVRVAREADFPIGASRIVNWGDQVILVIRRDAQAYAALQGAGPSDECILRWEAEALRVVSPCTYVVYDLHGNVVSGLTHEPLRRYAVFVRGGVIYVTG